MTEELPLGHSFRIGYVGATDSTCTYPVHRDPINTAITVPCGKGPRDHAARQPNAGCRYCITTTGMNVRCSCDTACSSPHCPADIETYVPPPVPKFERTP